MASPISKICCFVAMMISVLGASNRCDAATLFGPTPYLSSADIPAGFYLGGSPVALEDLEDGSLDFGLGLVNGFILGAPSGHIDSVDADDGVIDGSGLGGTSVHLLSAGGITVLFPSLPTAAGLVYTDNPSIIPNDPTTLEVFGPGMVSLGTFGPYLLGDDSDNGTTAEDRCFGFHDGGGIAAILIAGTGPIEIDHFQYGQMVPEPASLILWCWMGAIGLTVSSRQRVHCRRIVVGGANATTRC